MAVLGHAIIGKDALSDMARELAEMYGTQYQAALAVGVAPTTYNRWCNNKSKPTGVAAAMLRKCHGEAKQAAESRVSESAE